MAGFSPLKGLMLIPVVTLAAACAQRMSPPVQLPANLPTVNQSFRLDNNLAAQGEQLFITRGCIGCHAVGRRLAGPDLFGVVERRSIDWLKGFIKDTPGMLASDPIAQALLEEFNGAAMPQVQIRDPEIDAVIHYLAAESQRVRAKRGG
jgi:mono/diheme cytochrome c family protein